MDSNPKLATESAVAIQITGVTLSLGTYAAIHLAALGLAIHGFTIPDLVVLAMSWVLALSLIIWVLRVERGDLASFGMGRPTVASLGWGLLGVVATFAAMAIYYRVIAPMFGAVSPAPATFNSVAQMPLSKIVMACATAGFCEELIFRFYAISRLHRLTGNIWIASIVPMIVFVGLHLPGFGLAQVLPVTCGAVVLTILYWQRHDFWSNFITHFVTDFVAFGAAAALGH